MNLPLSQSILELGFEAARQEAVSLLQRKYRQLSKIENKDLSAITDSECRRHQALQEEIRVMAGIIQGFDDYAKSLLELIAAQQDKLHGERKVKEFALNSAIEEMEAKPDPNAQACGRSKFIPEVSYVPGCLRSQINFILNK